MGNVVSDSMETYSSNIRLVVLFSIPFLITLLIPLFAPLPTFISAGATFIRSASIFTNLSFTKTAVILVAEIFSVLFLSFAFVAINLIVKSRRTHVRVQRRVLQDIEKYIGKVFVLVMIYAILLVAVNIAGYYFGDEAVLTSVVGLVLFIPLFYAPSAIVIDDKKTLRAVKDSVRLAAHSPQYLVLWLVLALLVVSVLDYVIIAVAGTLFSRYVMLVVNSLFVLPYFVILQAESYMKRFPMIRH